MSDYKKNSRVDWRWTAAPIRVFGIDPLVLLFVPFLFIFGFDWLAIITFLALIGLAVYVAFTTKHGSILKFFATLKTKHIQGAQWKLPRH